MGQITVDTEKTCCRQVKFEIIKGKIYSVEFVGGCPGGLKAISALLEGMNIDDAFRKLDGITCGSKGTSCTGQLIKAIESEVISDTLGVANGTDD